MNLPEPFLTAMKKQLGAGFEAFVEALHTPPPVSVRLHPKKLASPAWLQEPVPWASRGFYATHRPVFAFDPAWHAGAYYVQEAASMFLEQVWNQLLPSLPSKKTVLDLCAAPGGKSTHLLSLLDDDDLLITNEPLPKRNAILRENITKWGYPSVIVTQGEAENFSHMGSVFDVVLVDAPCSGEGMFRKDPDSILEWSPENKSRCAIRQSTILRHILPALKPGGLLIYSTCTYNPEENIQPPYTLIRDNQMTSVSLSIDSFPDITCIQQKDFFGYAFYPHRTRAEGFFLTVLRKLDDRPVLSQPLRGSRNLLVPAAMPEFPLITQQEKYQALRMQQEMVFFPKQHLSLLHRLLTVVPIRQTGLGLGQYKGKDFIPDHALALANEYSGFFPEVELNEHQTDQYLRMNHFTVDSTLKGIVCFTCKGLRLGFGKMLPGRINNYYPKNWRILKDA